MRLTRQSVMTTVTTVSHVTRLALVLLLLCHTIIAPNPPAPGYEEGRCLDVKVSNSTNPSSSKNVKGKSDTIYSNNNNNHHDNINNNNHNNNNNGNNDGINNNDGNTGNALPINNPGETIIPPGGLGDPLGIGHPQFPSGTYPETNLPSSALKQVLNPSNDVYDYSKLTNSQLRTLLNNAARKASLISLKGKEQSSNTILGSIKIAQGLGTGHVPSYTDLARQLNDLTDIAKIQREQAQANVGKTGFVPPRKRRSTRSRQKRISDLEWSLFLGGNIHPSDCECMEMKELAEEDEYLIHPSPRYQCYGNLVCACKLEGVT